MTTHFKIIVATYNCGAWIKRNISMLISQTYTNWECVIVNDASTDNTLDIITKLTSDRKNIMCINNLTNMGALYNQVYGIYALNPDNEDVIIFVDGDDWLHSPDSLKNLSKYYEDKNTWMTYGNYIEYPIMRVRCVNIPMPPNYNPRKGRWLFSHLRTCKFFLFKNLRKEDFCFTGTNTWFKATGDCAVMRPIAELAGRSHIKYIKEVLLTYNYGNPAGDGKLHPQLQGKCGQDISNKIPYTERTKEELIKVEDNDFFNTL